MPATTRHTSQRQAVLRTIKTAGQPLRPGEVYDALRRVFPALSRATVYRSLHWLAQRGEVYQVEREDGSVSFAGHAYHRLTSTCQRCGKTKQIMAVGLPEQINAQLDDLPVVFFSTVSVGGLCRDCLQKISTKTTPS